MSKVLQCNVYLADLKDYDGMNKVFHRKFGDEPLVRTTIAAAGGIPGNSLVEIDVIACILAGGRYAAQPTSCSRPRRVPGRCFQNLRLPGNVSGKP